MKEKTCCVTGHRDIPADKLDDVIRALEREVKQALADGYRVFMTGFAQGADMLFARCVSEQRRRCPDIFLEAAIPYAGRVGRLNANGRLLLSKCDGVRVIGDGYRPGCYFERNRYMVESSGRVIAVYDGRSRGGTRYTIDYARETGRELRIIEI